MYYIKFIIPDLTKFVKFVLGIMGRFYTPTLFKPLRGGGGQSDPKLLFLFFLPIILYFDFIVCVKFEISCNNRILWFFKALLWFFCVRTLQRSKIRTRPTRRLREWGEVTPSLWEKISPTNQPTMSLYIGHQLEI